MRVAVVADAHLGGPGGEPVPLIRQLESLSPETCSRLVILGDLFQAWVGNRRFETDDVVSVTSALRDLRDSGVPLHYIEGNRDFFIAGSVYDDIFESVGEEFAFETGGRRFLAVHGDGIDERDRLYRFWRRASKNPLVRAATRLLPGWLARGLMSWFERQLSKTNFKHKKQLPVEVIEDYARRRLREGHDVVLLGHFHEQFHRRLAEGEVIVFEAWFRSRRIEWLGEAAAGGP